MTVPQTYQIGVSYHQFHLTPFGVNPIIDSSLPAGPLLAFDPQVPGALIILTGGTDGPVDVTVHIGLEPLPDLAAAADGWDVGQQAAIPIEGDMYLVPLMGSGSTPLVYTPAAPGLHLVRVLARGRRAHHEGVDGPNEDYDITITPITADPGRQATAGDGLYIY
ncbi:hypothetical protein [Kribbella sp. NPDC004875]|uniref:hypothetical protein n=1 Tax=Kribbella sp. NPDC004875 TaxID=3364107 RepID=UPI0036BFD4DC